MRISIKIQKRCNLSNTFRGSGTCVDAGVGGRDPELRLDELGDKGDESGDYGALSRVGQTDKQEGHVAQDPHGSLGEL